MIPSHYSSLLLLLCIFSTYSFVFFVLPSFLRHCSTHNSSNHSYVVQSSPNHTVSQQYSHPIQVPSDASLLFACSRTPRICSHFLLVFLLLSGDNELNPGPATFTVCILSTILFTIPHIPLPYLISSMLTRLISSV